MIKPCPGCGVIPVPEARFCRLCGAPLMSATLGQNEPPVSPLAQTMPLTGEGRPTNGLRADASGHGVTETARVGRREIESILRRVQAEHGDNTDSPGPRVEPTTAQTTTLSSNVIADPPPHEVAPAPPSLPVDRPAQIPSNTRARRMWQIAAIALLFVALVAGGLAFILSRRSGPADNGSASPISISDQKQLVAEKLAEAATLMTAGEYNHAVEVLRMAVKLDPANADAHLRLGEALDKVGSRNEAIEEFRAATQSDPNSIPAWRALAAAQFEERLYSDAAESYRRLVAANGSNVDDPTWLAYADALRFAGRTEEARSAYQKVASSTSSDVARSARKHLAEIGPPAVAAADQPRDARSDSEHNPKAAEATASPTPAAVAQSTPAVVIAGPQIDFDSYYFQAVNIVNGRDPRQIERADLLRALTLFQRAAQGGSHRAEAQAFVNRLGREYDRRKKW
ncbi:MAG: hypothetical protein QOJ64_2122 [Acidobacteriota bacterium]|nr:hypothetical protein [Acidobacteriota bacterium]